MDPADRAYLTSILSQLKLAQNEKAEAEKEFDLWVERTKLAKEKRDRDLFDAARERAYRAQEVIQRCEATIMELEVQRDTVKQEIRSQVNPAVIQSQKLVESLKGTDLDPDHARLDRLAKQADAEDALAALKRQMNED